jgi:hypothetical protein
MESEQKTGLGAAKEYALSDTDIQSILGPVPIITYPDLERYDTIDDLFDRKGRAILFFPNAAENVGHWTCLLRRPNMIEFFDPYGEKPEDQKDGLSKTRLQQLDLDQPLLTQLMRASKKPVYYNSHAFQSSKQDVATCGRHCVARLLYQPYSIDKYASIIRKSGLKPDDFVVGLTYAKIHK